MDFHAKSYLTQRSGLNLRFVAWIIGVLCLVQVPFLLITLGISLYFDWDGGGQGIGITTLIMGVVGGILSLIGRRGLRTHIGRRESMMAVTLSWLVVGLIGMLPFYLGGYTSLVDAFFETISGITTTGATIFPDVESLPRSILFWRSILQWQGGVGIIVFMVAVIPMVGENASMVFNSETSGITHDRFLPRIGEMAKWTMLIYVALSLLCFLFLWMGPMSLFEAVCHTCCCIATGGFSVWNDSMAHYNSTYTNVVLIFFMLMGATNFTLVYHVVSRKNLKLLFKDGEFRWFMIFFGIMSSIAVLWLYFSGEFSSPLEALERGVFNVASLVTTTGYAYGDYSQWGGPMAYIVMISMFIAGSSGSTSGGLKVIRLKVLLLSLSNQIRTILHPHAVVPVRINGHALSNDVTLRVMVFFFAYLGIVMIGTIAVVLQGFGLTDSLSIAISCASNSGGGLGSFGPAFGVSTLSAVSKLILALVMVMGRLEIFTVLVLFYRNFWKS